MVTFLKYQLLKILAIFLVPFQFSLRSFQLQYPAFLRDYKHQQLIFLIIINTY